MVCENLLGLLEGGREQGFEGPVVAGLHLLVNDGGCGIEVPMNQGGTQTPLILEEGTRIKQLLTGLLTDAVIPLRQGHDCLGRGRWTEGRKE